MAHTMLWLSNYVLCNTLGMAVILRVHGHGHGLGCCPLLSSLRTQFPSTRHPGSVLSSTRCASPIEALPFREGPPPHHQASLFIYGALEFLTSPPSAVGGGCGKSGHRWRLFTSSRSMVWWGGSEGILALTKCVSVFVHLRYEVRVKVPCGIWSFCIMKAGM